MLSNPQEPPGPEPIPLVLKPKAGSLYAHVFENPRTGVARDLYWNVHVDFEPVQFDGEEWDCSFAVEWLTWPNRRWRDLDGLGLRQVRRTEFVECSLYLLAEHNPAALRHLELRENGHAAFDLDFSAIADVDDGSGLRRFEVSGKCEVEFSGVIVVTDNLQPKPASPDDARAAVAEFLALDDLAEPRSEQWRYVLEPLP